MASDPESATAMPHGWDELTTFERRILEAVYCLNCAALAAVFQWRNWGLVAWLFVVLWVALSLLDFAVGFWWRPRLRDYLPGFLICGFSTFCGMLAGALGRAIAEHLGATPAANNAVWILCTAVAATFLVQSAYRRSQMEKPTEQALYQKTRAKLLGLAAPVEIDGPPPPQPSAAQVAEPPTPQMSAAQIAEPPTPQMSAAQVAADKRDRRLSIFLAGLQSVLFFGMLFGAFAGPNKDQRGGMLFWSPIVLIMIAHFLDYGFNLRRRRLSIFLAGLLSLIIIISFLVFAEPIKDAWSAIALPLVVVTFCLGYGFNLRQRLGARWKKARARRLAIAAKNRQPTPPPPDASIGSCDALPKPTRIRKPRPLGCFLISLLLFILFGSLAFSRLELAWLVGTLLLHESGHYVSMRLFGYRDLRMFFIPLLGAAVTGDKTDKTGWQEGVTLLCGPPPGLLLGCGIYFVNLAYPLPGLRPGVAWLVVLNFLNLLPIGPLDGGRLCQLLLFQRFRLLEAGATVLSAVLFILLLVGAGWVDVAIVAVISFRSFAPRSYQRATAAASLRSHWADFPAKLSDLDDARLRDLFLTTRREFGDSTLAVNMQSVYSRALRPFLPPSSARRWLITIYLGAIVLSVATLALTHLREDTNDRVSKFIEKLTNVSQTELPR